MLRTIVLASEAASINEEVHLPIPPIMYGVITLGIFLFLLLVTWMFKNVSHRQSGGKR